MADNSEIFGDQAAFREAQIELPPAPPQEEEEEKEEEAKEEEAKEAKIELSPEISSHDWDKDYMYQEQGEEGDLKDKKILFTGIYPDIENEDFAEKLTKKKEFYDARAKPFSDGDVKGDGCSLEAFEAFTLSPIQRLVSRFMNPNTPFLGLLLYHGVGVGKTISAISIAENFLAERPTKRTYIVVPRSIAPGFKRTIFDADLLRPATADDPGRFVYKGWYSAQATGTTYLKLINATQFDEKEKIVFRIEALKRARYGIKGYMAFKLGIDKEYKKMPSSITDQEKMSEWRRNMLRERFNDSLIIIDEAHNLRQDPKTLTADEIAPDENPDMKAVEEGAEAKAIVPLLLEILQYTEGCRIVLMTATPMFNTAPEIIFLLNLLILNDKKKKEELLPSSLFEKGFLKPGAEGEDIIRDVAKRYVSYMRGENPFTFPIRLHPALSEEEAEDSVEEWYPTMTALQGGKPINPPVSLEIKQGIAALPIQRIKPLTGSICEKVIRFQMNILTAEQTAAAEEGLSELSMRRNVLDTWTQIGNFTYPSEKWGKDGWDEYFREDKRLVEWRADTPIDSVFGPDALEGYAPKIAKILNTVKTSRGINFIYSRYVQPGALPVCIALERAGYTRVNANGEPVPLLRGSPPVARQCAMCPRKQHGPLPKEECVGFHPANYVLLTSDYTPNNVGATVTYATTFPSPVDITARGSRVKVIVGSQIASEGLDLKCIREIHVLDPWYHLNRLEQVIGRGVRYCSHRALLKEQRNCLIHLYSLFLDDYETSDLYSYRLAVQKAKAIGLVQRQLKMGAWDCALNHEGILLTGDIKQHHIDAQGTDLGLIPLADKANSSMCDYQECSFTCKLDIQSISEDNLDLSTFTAKDARAYILLRESALREMFSVQPYWPINVVRSLYKELPPDVLTQALPSVINNRSFELKFNGQPGYLILRAGYVVFQPRDITDTSIPMAIRFKKPMGPKLWARVARPQPGPFAGAGSLLAEAAAESGSVDDSASVGSSRTGGTGGTAGSSGSWSTGLLPAKEWLRVVNEALAGKVESFPDELKTKMKGLDQLEIIARHFGALARTKEVLLGFGYDHFFSYDTKQSLLTNLMKGNLDKVGLGEYSFYIQKNTFKNADVEGFFILDIKNNRVDIYCKIKGQMTYSQCASTMTPFVQLATNDEAERAGRAGAPIKYINAKCGSLFGFLVAKPEQNTLRTMTVENSSGGALTGGADCMGVSNKEPHLKKIKILNDALMVGNNPDLNNAKYPVTISKDKKISSAKDFTDASEMKQSTLCIYLEFLCRLMDAYRVQTNGIERRWFLNDVEFKRSLEKEDSQWPKGKM
jgi:hypothetical protein